MGLLIVKTNDLKYVGNIPEADYLDNIYNDLFDIFPLLPPANEVAESWCFQSCVSVILSTVVPVRTPAHPHL